MTPQRSNPFQPIYDICNEGGSRQKLANLPEFPRMIDIEMTNTCNFRCLMCPTGNFSQKRDKGFISDEVFYKILDDIRPYRTPLRFIRWGEPLTHPNIVAYLRDAEAAGSLSHVNTNGSKLTEEMMDALIAIPLSSLKFSLQGVDAKSYGEMRNIDFFDGLLETIRCFNEKRGDRPLPYTHISTTITYESPEQVRAFDEGVRGLVDKVSIGHTVLEWVDLNAVRVRPHELETLKWLKQQESLVKIHPECPEVFDKLSINWDGSVTACCGDSDNLMIIGDVMKNSIMEIWESEQLNHYRRLLADMRHEELPLCRTCYDYHGLHAPAETRSPNLTA